jgi:hypothetical protein
MLVRGLEMFIQEYLLLQTYDLVGSVVIMRWRAKLGRPMLPVGVVKEME